MITLTQMKLTLILSTTVHGNRGKNDAPPSPISPQGSQEVGTSSRRKCQAERKKEITGTDANYEATRRHLIDERNRITSPTHEEDDDEIPVPRESTTTPKRIFRGWI